MNENMAFVFLCMLVSINWCLLAPSYLTKESISSLFVDYSGFWVGHFGFVWTQNVSKDEINLITSKQQDTSLQSISTCFHYNSLLWSRKLFRYFSFLQWSLSFLDTLIPQIYSIYLLYIYLCNMVFKIYWRPPPRILDLNISINVNKYQYLLVNEKNIRFIKVIIMRSGCAVVKEWWLVDFINC